jgi:hypothetical protein
MCAQLKTEREKLGSAARDRCLAKPDRERAEPPAAKQKRRKVPVGCGFGCALGKETLSGKNQSPRRVGGRHSCRIEENSARELLYAEQRSSGKTQYLVRDIWEGLAIAERDRRTPRAPAAERRSSPAAKKTQIEDRNQNSCD